MSNNDKRKQRGQTDSDNSSSQAWRTTDDAANDQHAPSP